MKNFILILIFGLSGLTFAEHAVAHNRATLKGVFKQIAKYGFCEADGLNIDMQNVLKIENDTIFSTDPNSLWSSVTLSGDKTKFTYAKGNSSDISLLTAINDDSIVDIRLRFALYENEVILYWEETYENKIQKLGLMKFDVKADRELDWVEPEFANICRGSKGVNSSH